MNVATLFTILLMGNALGDKNICYGNELLSIGNVFCDSSRADTEKVSDFGHMQQLFLHKKTNENPRSFDLEKESDLKGVAIEPKELSHLKEILSRCQRKKVVLYVPGSESPQYFGLINDKNQTKDYLWMVGFDLLYYPKSDRYYVIKYEEDKEWMKRFFEKYEKMF